MIKLEVERQNLLAAVAQQASEIVTLSDTAKRLRQELSLAEEGLANYAQENAQLKEQLRTAIPAIATLKETRQELEAQLGWMIQHAGVEWHGWWSSRIGETSEPLRSQIKALLYPDGYPSERPAVPQPAEQT